MTNTKRILKMQIILNGEPYTVFGTTSISSLLEKLELDVGKVAVERNLEILPHSLFGETQIAEGDQLEIVHFIGGG